MATPIILEPRQITKCKRCGADIAFLKSKKGTWYVVSADYAVDGQPATHKTNFHRCPEKTTQELNITKQSK